MRVADCMHADLKTVQLGDTIADAVLMMSDHHISALPVVDVHGKPLGVLSTADVLRAAADCGDAGERDELFVRTPVADLMTPRAATIALDAPVKEAAQQMLYLEIHRLFVEDEGRLVGVISQSDIVRGVAMAKL